MRLQRVRIFYFAATAVSIFIATAGTARAVGESVNGFPNWSERVMHEWTNRARVDPQLEMTACGAPCGEKACYSVTTPVWYKEELNHVARFHAAEQAKQNYFAHNSNCTIVSNIDSIYPESCDGSASCACVGGISKCETKCNDPWSRCSLFGVSCTGEIIASPADPDYAFYLWLFEPSSSTDCALTPANGHRGLLLTSQGSVGFGSSGISVGNFSSHNTPYPIASGSHYPRTGQSVEAWANWFDTAAPKSATVNLDGACAPMTLTRGTVTNGAWKATLTNVATGCHRYVFAFTDSKGTVVTYPSTGSLGIGAPENCADWDASRPAMGSGCPAGGDSDGVDSTNDTDDDNADANDDGSTNDTDDNNANENGDNSTDVGGGCSSVPGSYVSLSLLLAAAILCSSLRRHLLAQAARNSR